MTDSTSPSSPSSPTPTTSFWGPFRRQHPNILILMTDQQRTVQHYPPDWIRDNLPNLHHLRSYGVTFPNAMTNTTACSPSRATLFTGTYPATHGVTEVGMTLDPDRRVILPGDTRPLPVATLGRILQDESLLPKGVRYEIAYKGKWHLNSEFVWGLSPKEQRRDEYVEDLMRDNSMMEEVYGFSGWTSPEIGNKMDLRGPDDDDDGGGDPPEKEREMNTLGAGVGGNDERVTRGTSYPSPSVRSAVDFLKEYTPNQDGTNPFFLVVSLVNPHDVWVHPSNLAEAGFTRDEDGKYPWQYPPFTEISVPESFHLTEEELANKPSIQGEGPWRMTDWDVDVATDYVRFYAYLETLSDALLGKVVEALRGNPHNLEDDTLIVRLADHGEMAMAQGGMREKEHNCYNETLLVPMTFSNPGLVVVPESPRDDGEGGGEGATCTDLAGLVDVVPTVAAIVGIDIDALRAKYPIQGTSLDDAILIAAGTGRGGDEGATVQQDQLLFVTDDEGAHIRCLIDNGRHRAKYAVYYRTEEESGRGGCSSGNPNGAAEASSFQYEMYPFWYDAGGEGGGGGSQYPAWDEERGNILPVDGLPGTGSSSRLPWAWVRVLWHDMHVALTAKLLECGQMPDNWPDPPEPLPSPPGGRLSMFRGAISRRVNWGAFGL